MNQQDTRHRSWWIQASSRNRLARLLHTEGDRVPREIGMPNKQEIKGRAQQIKGRVKEAVGRVTNNPRQEAEGRDDQVTGAAKETVGTVRRNVKEAVEGVKRGLRSTDKATR
jgi:uncharacterized protein YjbJ (UPF0337 family)